MADNVQNNAAAPIAAAEAAPIAVQKFRVHFSPGCHARCDTTRSVYLPLPVDLPTLQAVVAKAFGLEAAELEGYMLRDVEQEEPEVDDEGLAGLQESANGRTIHLELAAPHDDAESDSDSSDSSRSSSTTLSEPNERRHRGFHGRRGFGGMRGGFGGMRGGFGGMRGGFGGMRGGRGGGRGGHGGFGRFGAYPAGPGLGGFQGPFGGARGGLFVGGRGRGPFGCRGGCHGMGPAHRCGGGDGFRPGPDDRFGPRHFGLGFHDPPPGFGPHSRGHFQGRRHGAHEHSHHHFGPPPPFPGHDHHHHDHHDHHHHGRDMSDNAERNSRAERRADRKRERRHRHRSHSHAHGEGHGRHSH